MKILILGGDGYLGWPTAMHFSEKGYDVTVMDNFGKRGWEVELGIEHLIPIPPLQERIKIWKEVSGKTIKMFVGDLRNYELIDFVLEKVKPDAVVHYAEQPSAPYSMLDNSRAVFTQTNNVIGTLNLLYAIKKNVPGCHLIKLGTMGEYGTPNIDIEEGYLDITHNGRTDKLPFPKVPGSMYHLSKVHDSHNIHFACRIWGLKSTDLNQGVVYGLETDQIVKDERLNTSFHYDEVFGTALNRFCVQAVAGVPLTLYGKGTQTRGFLNIKDTLQCIELAAQNAPDAGEFRVYNQFTEQFSVTELAEKVAAVWKEMGNDVRIDNVPNPRIEKEEHYYNAKHTKLLDLGLKPHYLDDGTIKRMLEIVGKYAKRINPSTIQMNVRWDQEANNLGKKSAERLTESDPFAQYPIAVGYHS